MSATSPAGEPIGGAPADAEPRGNHLARTARDDHRAHTDRGAPHHRLGRVHLYLRGESSGYRLIPAVGPLFLAQGIAGVLIGLALIVTRRVAVVLAAAGLLAPTAAGLVIMIEIGLFGFRESRDAPYVSTSLYEEITGGVLLLIAAWSLARSPSRAADQPFSRP